MGVGEKGCDTYAKLRLASLLEGIRGVCSLEFNSPTNLNKRFD
jgi:hypothetical protein